VQVVVVLAETSWQGGEGASEPKHVCHNHMLDVPVQLHSVPVGTAATRARFL